MSRPNLRTSTTALVALAVPVTLLVGLVTAAIFKSVNPDNVDVTQGLAYLEYTMIAIGLTFALFLLASVIGIVQMYRQDRNFSNAKFPLTMLVAICLIMVGVLGANAYTSKVQDDYLIKNGRPTLDQFFNALEDQKQ